ncbi:lactonase family protein [Flexivirga caeni]|uniref:3-carboxymuconate cyclase n=1 Tax=Flexivirga caeni TaxID=2294115 RepID=A0A3M9MGS0_9MICO|nr:beta-propeller fold lactonase family protein [Flexivirga caeni]RNI24716.1 hypothetical protein EFY87_03175 [Flexivirga caeni]
MQTISKIASAAALAAAAGTVFAAPAHAATQHHGHTRAGAVFVQNNSTSGNSVIAYDRSANGSLTEAGSYPTGGKGGQLSGSVADHLSSEGSVAYNARAHLLYTVNAGSDTVTVFSVWGDRLTRLQVVPTGGDFPVSIAVHGSQVFVLNARDGGTVSGFVQFGGVLIRIPFWQRHLNLNTSAPGQPNEFVSTPGQIGFTPDGRQLLISTKNGGNSVLSFAVGPFGPAATPTTTSLPGTVPFGFDFDAHGHLVITEAATNKVATFTVNRNGSLTALDSAATGQTATCWLVTSHNTAYASNAGSGTVSIYRTDRAGMLTSKGTAATNPGTVDAATSHGFLYVETGVGGVVDSYRIKPGGGLAMTGSVTIPNGIGAEGIVAS